MKRNGWMRFGGTALLLACATALLASCVSTHVASSASLSARTAHVQRVAIVFSPIPAGCNAANIAGLLGARNLRQLAPHLRDRVPALFTKNGLPARMVEQDAAAPVPVATGEYPLWIRATSAYYNSHTGQALYLQADLLDPASGRSLWTSRISMETLGFGQFDDTVADSLALQLLERLRADRVVALAAGPLLDFDGKPVEVGPGLLRSARLAPQETGFAKLDDPMAVPFLNDKGREGYRAYLSKPYPRAFAIAPNGAWGSAHGGSDPQGRALDGCNRKGKDNCMLYSFDGMVVWRP